MALAYGGPFYKPPVNVCRMGYDLSALPLWYAPMGSDVWLSDARQVKWMDTCPFSLGVNGVLGLSPIYNKVSPWGWSASIARRLMDEGVDEVCCPSKEQMERIRSLSSRITAVEILGKMDLPDTIGKSQRVDLIEQCDYHGEMFLLKAPWSGSGRGIQKITCELSPSMQGWVKHILKTQGCLIKEPYYNKVVDFAMEFLSDNEGVHWAGYSLFETDVRGIYKENWLASNDMIREMLVQYVPEEVLQMISSRLEILLEEVVDGAYQGYLGVDMMVVRVPEGYVVHPCVEINLRMNMGVVSRLFYDRYVSPVVQGRFVIEYYPSPGEALLAHEMMQRNYPLMMEQNKIRQGYMSLTPVFDDTAYQAYVIID